MVSPRKGESHDDFLTRQRAAVRARRELDEEGFLTRQRESYHRRKAANPEKIAAQQHQAYLLARERDPEARRRYDREYGRRWRAANQDRSIENGRRWRQNGGNEKLRLRMRARREIVLAAYGGACACCGETTYEFLCIDHVNGDGSVHRKAMGVKTGSGHLDTWLAKHGFPAGFQVLCHNCNAAKGFYGGCPHQREPAVA